MNIDIVIVSCQTKMNKRSKSISIYYNILSIIIFRHSSQLDLFIIQEFP